ncbi:GtrA family protein [Polynucleobacter sp. Ross1-W9]|nr:GtrA family protein [Polynucleobacter parvulilacunae]
MKNFDLRLLVRYAITGFITLFIYTTTLYFFYTYQNFSYSWSIVFSYFLAIFFHFLGNRFFSFRATNGFILIQFFRYIIVTLANFLIQYMVSTYLENIKLFNPFINAYIGIFMTIISGFIFSNFWIFKRSERDNCT